jgi:hypothetical protein
MDVDALVVREGDRVTATGRLVRDETGDWFEPYLYAGFRDAAPRRVKPARRAAVHVNGANFDDVTSRFEAGGAVEGFANVIGIWSHDQLQAIHQTMPENAPHLYPRWETPPCPPPAGGWPRLTWKHGNYNLNYDLGDLTESGAAVAVSTFRPSEDQAVLVVAAADTDAVEARLRPQLGELLCVVASRWTRVAFNAVRAQLDEHWVQWNLYMVGETTSEDGQARIEAKLTRVLPAIAEWAAPLPPGIVALDPWLRHAGRLTVAARC